MSLCILLQLISEVYELINRVEAVSYERAQRGWMHIGINMYACLLYEWMAVSSLPCVIINYDELVVLENVL